jgi:hypothetical protein
MKRKFEVNKAIVINEQKKTGGANPPKAPATQTKPPPAPKK